jgi:PAS domain S-box-containing protein
MDQGPFSLSPQVKRLWPIIHLGWLLIIAGSAWINHYYSQQEMEKTALAEAKAIYQRDTAFRAWVAGYGGIYAPVNEQTPPNPYLANRPDRDQSKRDGTPLTLVNPAYMVRLVNDFQGKPVTHLTSLKPLRPENRPDAWEKTALERLEQDNLPEVFEFTTRNNEPYLLYLHATRVESGCLRCHASQGYQLGDIRGGMAIALPLGEILALHENTLSTMLSLHLLIYLIGAALLIWGQRLLGRRVRERDLVLAALEESEANFRTVADFAYAWEYWLGPDGEMKYVSPSVKELTGYGAERFMTDRDFLKTIVAEDDREILHHHIEIEKHLASCAVDFRIRTAAGEIRWLHHICRSVYDRHGLFLGRRASNYDITEEKVVKHNNDELIGQLREALDKVKTLRGFIPICASCKKIRDDRGYWNQVEAYISKHSEAVFSHGICPDCAHRLYPEYYPLPKNGEEQSGVRTAAVGDQALPSTEPPEPPEPQD